MRFSHRFAISNETFIITIFYVNADITNTNYVTKTPPTSFFLFVRVFCSFILFTNSHPFIKQTEGPLSKEANFEQAGLDASRFNIL